MDNNTIFILFGSGIMAIIIITILIILIIQKQKKIKKQLNMAIDIGKLDLRDNNGQFLTVEKLFNLLKKISKQTS